MTAEIVASDVQLLGRRQDRPTSEAKSLDGITADTTEVAPDEIPF